MTDYRKALKFSRIQAAQSGLRIESCLLPGSHRAPRPLLGLVHAESESTSGDLKIKYTHLPKSGPPICKIQGKVN